MPSQLKRHSPKPPPAPHAVCQRLAALRIRHFGPRGKQKFARGLKLPLSTYCTYESNRLPPVDVLVKAAELTACDLRWLLTGWIGQTPTEGLSADESAILQRLGALLTDKPQARQALEALADLLSEAPDRHRPSDNIVPAEPETPPTRSDEHIVPIIGSAAAGHVLFWGDEQTAAATDLRAFANEVLATDAGNIFSARITDAAPPYGQAGQARIVELPQTRQIGNATIDGVILVTGKELGEKLVAVRIDGESMADVLNDGDYLIADTASWPGSGEIGVVMIEGQAGATCKIYLADAGQVRLVPANPVFETFVTRREHIRYAWRAVGAIRQGRQG